MIEFKNKLTVVGFVAIAAVIVVLASKFLQEPGLPQGIASGNGRLEATQIDVTTKFGGRLAEVLVKEGDNVKASEVLANMDVRELEAELRLAQAALGEITGEFSSDDLLGRIFSSFCIGK